MNPATTLIAGIDFSRSSAAVLRHAVHAARIADMRVLAIHVLDASRLAHRNAMARKEPDMGFLFAQAGRKLDDLVAAEVPGAEVRTEILSGRPADELYRAVEQNGASMLVIAANDLTKKRLGSIASRCVRAIPCDVLVLRDWQDGNFRKILICADFSPTSAKALARGVELAAAHGAGLEIAHVMYPPSRDIWGEVLEHEMDSPVSYGDECRARANRTMTEFLAPQAEALAGIDHQAIILESASPASALTFHAEDSGADLVILGTRSHSRLASYFLGTNAERLLQDATVSVLAVRA